VRLGFLSLPRPDQPDGYGKTIPGDQIAVNLDHVAMLAPTKVVKVGTGGTGGTTQLEATEITLTCGRQVVVMTECWALREAILKRESECRA